MQWKRVLLAFVAGVAVNAALLPLTFTLGRWSFWAVIATLSVGPGLLMWALRIHPLERRGG